MLAEPPLHSVGPLDDTSGGVRARRASVLSRDDGGIESQEPDGTPGSEIYYIGIIDILQEYNTRKKLEFASKAALHPTKRDKISCVPPDAYQPRFVSFIASHVK